MIKFRTFNPHKEHDYYRGNCTVSAAQALNKWLEEHPDVEVVSWQACPAGDHNELYITIQYKEN